MLNLKYFTKCSFSNDSNQLKIFKYCIFPVFLFEYSCRSNCDTLLNLVCTIWILFLSIMWCVVLYFKFILMICIIVTKLWCCIFLYTLSSLGIFFQQIWSSDSKILWRVSINTSLFIFFSSSESLEIFLWNFKEL